MKKVLILSLFLAVMVMGTRVSAQDKVYKDGSAWQVSFIKTEANMTDVYLNSLKDTWQKMHQEALKQGLILSSKILASAAANPDDFDIMLMVEYKNLAAMESSDEKWEAISKTVIGGEDMMKKINEGRVNIRSIYGEKLFREVVYK